MRDWMLAAWVALAACGVARAAPPSPESPVALVERLTADVLEAIRQDPQLRAGDRDAALALAERKVLPYIDFRRMAALAVGRAWRRASPAQQDVLAAEFRAMLIRTYATAIGAYRGQTMEVESRQPGGDADEVVVRNRFLNPGRAPVRVDYWMHRTPEGWKAYDIVVGGVSLVTSYRSSFQEEVERGGVEGLIARMREANRRPQPAGYSPGSETSGFDRLRHPMVSGVVLLFGSSDPVRQQLHELRYAR